MSVIGDMKLSIIDTISRAIQNIRVVDEFNEQDIHNIGRQPVVCVYVKRVEANHIAFGDVLSFEYDGQKTCTQSGKQITATIGLDIYLRNRGNGNTQTDISCDLLFEQIAELVMFDNEISVSHISRGEISFKQNYQAYMLTAELQVDDIFAKSQQSMNLSGFKLDINVN